MASGNVLRNRKRFVSEKLDMKHGEQILFGSLDGEAMVIADWWNMNERARRDRLSVRMNRTPMTLIPTNQRIVFYQAKGGFMPDRMTQIPLDALRDVSFEVYPEANKRGTREIWALTTFVTDQYSEHPSVMFRTRITDLYTFNAERRVILPGICRVAKVKLADTTDYDMIASSGISRMLTDNSEVLFEDMMANGERPSGSAAYVELPNPDAPVYDRGHQRQDGRKRKGRPPHQQEQGMGRDERRQEPSTGRDDRRERRQEQTTDRDDRRKRRPGQQESRQGRPQERRPRR